jgi:hypothetical protein
MSNTDQIQKIASDIMREKAMKVFTVKCTACAKSHTQTLSWLQAKRFVCPSCGGRLGDGPLHQLTLLAIRKLRGDATTPKKRPARRVKPVADAQFDASKGHQLVLQFRGDSLADFDAMVALVEDLTEQLGNSADVDGHDFGSGETNIFIFTSDPAVTFDQVRPVLERRQQLQAVTAAFRQVSSEDYTVIWPEGSQKRFVIT